MKYIDDIVKKSHIKKTKAVELELSTEDMFIDYKHPDYQRHMNNLNGGYRGMVGFHL